MRPYPVAVRAPAIPDGLEWFNGSPGRVPDGDGRLTLLDFWTYG
ncbi:MAG: hypothetical protein AVDCRST_MAG70-928 [uncultured Thermomicrobiales bacterium]|uniref:Uncharacterized protein n=1 Tax=uncultured Thermomicrobiales bacterium TaxID=1645740 RepID=A0A6J4ULI4_9BACT|nr:MAG: hypothetical protein AVDCRST_MAG70-928 [uncultured Thermomicrobiales bacterium]